MTQTPAGELRATQFCSGQVDKVGAPDATITSLFDGRESRIEMSIPDHAAGLRSVVELLQTNGLGSIDCVGHRVVHGGPTFSEPAVINEGVIAAIQDW